MICPPGQVRNSMTKSCRDKKPRGRRITRKSQAKLLVKNLHINYTMTRYTNQKKPIQHAVAGQAHDIAGFIMNKKYYFCPDYKGETLIQSEENIFTDVLKTSKRIGLPINYFKFIPLIKKYNFTLLEKIFLRKKESKLNTIPLISPKLLIDDKNKIINFFLNKKVISDGNLQILRDEDWFAWRFFNNPFNRNIYYFEYENNFTIVHIFKANNIKRLNILYFFCSDLSKEDYLFLIIYKWALTNSIDLLWSNSSDENFINKLKETFKVISIKPLTFASYSSNELINKTLKKGINNIYAADSDNDIFQIDNNY